MTEKEYREHPAISRSDLWKLRESPEKFKYFMERPEPPSPALQFGQAVHKLLLEPDTFDDEFAVAPSVDRRYKAGKEAWAEFADNVGDRVIITADMYQQAAEMVKHALDTPYVKQLLQGEHEKPLFWVDDLTGEQCKCRLDCLSTAITDGIIVDYKTTTDASADGFIRSAINYGYDFQAGMYCAGYNQAMGVKPRFVFIAQEKEPPYAVNILEADELFVKRGYDIFRELIGIYHECKQSGNWYGYLGAYNVINVLGLPPYLAREVE